MSYRRNNIKKYVFISVFAAVVFTVYSFTTKTFAAIISISPATQQVVNGNVFRLNFSINTEGQAINNAEGVVQFPSDTVEILSIDSTSSIFGLWVEPPSFSNTTGKIEFNGGIANPGFTGSSGKVFSVVAKAKKEGAASFIFSSATIRANDGLGTNVLKSKNSGTVSVIAATSPKVPVVSTKTPPAVPISIPDKAITYTTNEAPILTSTTNKDQNMWYTTKDAILVWDMPLGIEGVQTSFDNVPDGIPAGPVIKTSQKEFKNIRDGISYFHIRFSVKGGWSPISTYVFRIDTIAPEETLAIVTTNTEGKPVIELEGSDTVSGIDYFTVAIEGAQAQKIVAQNNKATFLIPPMPHMGAYNVTITAFDKVGNKKESKTKIIIDTINPPTVETSSTVIKIGSTITITGVTPFPKQQVYVFMKSPQKEKETTLFDKIGWLTDSQKATVIDTDKKEVTTGLLGGEISQYKIEMFLVMSDDKGTFVFDSDKVKREGEYEIWTQVVNDLGEKSLDSNHIKIKVISTFVQRIIDIAIRYGYILLLFALVVVIIIDFKLKHKLSEAFRNTGKIGQ